MLLRTRCQDDDAGSVYVCSPRIRLRIRVPASRAIRVLPSTRLGLNFCCSVVGAEAHGVNSSIHAHAGHGSSGGQMETIPKNAVVLITHPAASVFW
jgi:hypothetical protein